MTRNDGGDATLRPASPSADAREPARGARRFGAWAAAALLIAGACDGDNLFGPGNETGGGNQPPEIVSLTAPDSVRSGARLDLRVVAEASQLLARFDLQLRRAIELDSVITVSSQLRTVTQDISVAVPETVQDSVLIIRVTATDKTGAVSEIRTDTVRVDDRTAPSVSARITGDAFGPGDSIRITISAADNVGLDSVGYLIRPTDGDTLKTVARLLVGAGGAKTEKSFVYVVPAGFPPASLRIFGLARDHGGRETLSSPAAFGVVDTEPPVVQVRTPGIGNHLGPLGPSDSVRIVVDVQDNADIEVVTFDGLAFRGDRSLGTFEAVTRLVGKVVTDLQGDTVGLTRYLRGSEEVGPDTIMHVVVSARDPSGNLAADTVRVRIGGPRVILEGPVDGQTVQSGRNLALRMLAFDPVGVSRVELNYTGSGGVSSGEIVRTFSPARTDTIVVDTAIAIASGVEGSLQIQTRAFNVQSQEGFAPTLSLTVAPGTPQSDTQPAASRLTLTGGSRMELTDSLVARVISLENSGGSGLVRVGATVVGINPARTDTLRKAKELVFTSPRTSADVSFRFAPFHVDALALPDTLTFQVHAYAIDDAGNCSVAVATTDQALPCDSTTFTLDTGAKAIVAASTNGQQLETLVVRGRTVLLPGGGRIADAVVVRNDASSVFRLFLSNYDRNRLEFLNLNVGGDPAAVAFGAPVSVGSAPWGLSTNLAGTRLIVANSGGTNFSFVDMLAATPKEQTTERLFTPDVRYYNVFLEQSETGSTYTVDPAIGLGYSDRPQFVTEDANGLLLYSTVPTAAAPDGTIRYVDRSYLATGGSPEVRMLRASTLSKNEEGFAFRNVDDVVSNGGTVTVYDHVPGQPSNVISATGVVDTNLVSTLQGLGSDVEVSFASEWSANSGLADTTFVAPSGDREFVAFGAGATSPTGEIFVWQADTRVFSPLRETVDLIHNASERVLGIALNQNGSMGVARGTRGAYFFTPADLRQQGIFDNALGEDAAGASMHPDHATNNTSDASTLAFVGSSARSIKIVDTFHFDEVAELQIRDNIVGPLRASKPLPGDAADVVMKLYGVTSAGGVVILDLRASDLTR